MGKLDKHGYTVFHNSDKPSETVIINTCGFINDAKQESVDTILSYAAGRNSNQLKNLIVMGCLSQRYKPELEKEIPEVDIYFGVDQFSEILDYLDIDYSKELAGERILTTPSHYAYLKIAEGCDRKCSFCAIPMIRGRHRSRTVEDIVKEANYLANSGVKELILISQDLSYYGLDIYKKSMLNELIVKLEQIEKIEWIRLHYLYPSNFPVEVLDTISQSEKICHYLDIPLQHISDRILKSMRRGITKKETFELVDLIRMKVPDAALRSTMITGYPGETDKEFIELLDFVSDTKFERMGVFPYSPEEDTAAFKLADDIPTEIKKERMDELMRLQENISFENNQQYVGKDIKVLIDGKEQDYYTGRSAHDSPEVDNEILIPSRNTTLITGNFYQVRINRAEEFDLFGEIK